MSSHELNNDDLIESLREQLLFLDNSIRMHESFEPEAKRIATTIRVLVHDTPRSTSLLELLNQKSGMYFINSSNANDGRMHSMTGLSGVRGNHGNHYFGLIAKFKTNNKFVALPLFRQHLKEWHAGYEKLDFESWWNMEIVQINESKLSRKDIVLFASNKDGGAHVDESLPNKYHIAKLIELKLESEGGLLTFDKNVIYASLTQIGWELQQSIREMMMLT